MVTLVELPRFKVHESPRVYRRLGRVSLSVSPQAWAAQLGRAHQSSRVCLSRANCVRRSGRSHGVVAGAATSEHLASSPDVAGVSGVYHEGGRETAPPEASRERGSQARLWRVLVGLAIAE